jgi:hypothetical protein
MELKPEHEKISAYYNIDNGTGRIRGIYLGYYGEYHNNYKKHRRYRSFGI